MDLSIIQDSEEKYWPTNAPCRKGHHHNTALRLTYSKRCDFVNFSLQFVLCLDRALNKLYKYFRFRPGLFPSLIRFSSDSSGGSIRDILVSLRWYFTKTNYHRTVLFGRETNVILWNDLSCLKTSPLVRAARSARVRSGRLKIKSYVRFILLCFQTNATILFMKQIDYFLLYIMQWKCRPR